MKNFLVTFLILGCLFTSPSGESSEPQVIRIGLVFDFSGKAEAVNDLVDGIENYTSEVNKKVKRIEIYRFDSAGGPLETRLATEKAALFKPKLDFLIAELDSSKAFAAAEVAEARKIPMITPLATSHKITDQRKYVFSGTFSDRVQGYALANFATHTLGAKSAAIIADEGQLYSVTLAEMFKEKFSNFGGKVVGELKILNDSNSLPRISKFLNENMADIYFIPVYSQTAARILEVAVKSKAVGAIFMGGDAWGQYSAPFKDLVFKNSNPLRIYWASHFDGNENTAQWEKVRKSATLAKNASFGIAQAAGYDAINIVYQAVQKAGGGGSKHEKVTEVLRKSKFTGLLGSVIYTDDNENSKQVHIFTASGGIPHHVDKK